jgi:hypothetical protein
MLKPLQIPSKFVRRAQASAEAGQVATPAEAVASPVARGATQAAGSSSMRAPEHRTEEAEVTGSPSQPNYFNLHVEGVGYLNRVRTIKPKNGQEFLACSVSAMRGSVDEIGYTRFDCRVSGAQARKVVRMLESEVAADKRVMVGFRIADIYPELFTYERGENKGQPGVAVRGRLLRIKFAKVDGAPVSLPEMPPSDALPHASRGIDREAEAVEDEAIPF